MLVACSLVNLTTWTVARRAFGELRERFPTPRDLSRAKPDDLHGALRPLGLWRRRSEGLVKLAHEWLRDPPRRARDVLRLPGCGRYAADSWAIFVDGRTDVRPDDGKLNWYMDRIRTQAWLTSPETSPPR